VRHGGMRSASSTGNLAATVSGQPSRAAARRWLSGHVISGADTILNAGGSSSSSSAPPPAEGNVDFSSLLMVRGGGGSSSATLDLQRQNEQHMREALRLPPTTSDTRSTSNARSPPSSSVPASPVGVAARSLAAQQPVGGALGIRRLAARGTGASAVRLQRDAEVQLPDVGRMTRGELRRLEAELADEAAEQEDHARPPRASETERRPAESRQRQVEDARRRQEELRERQRQQELRQQEQLRLQRQLQEQEQRLQAQLHQQEQLQQQLQQQLEQEQQLQRELREQLERELDGLGELETRVESPEPPGVLESVQSEAPPSVQSPSPSSSPQAGVGQQSTAASSARSALAAAERAAAEAEEAFQAARRVEEVANSRAARAAEVAEAAESAAAAAAAAAEAATASARSAAQATAAAGETIVQVPGIGAMRRNQLRNLEAIMSGSDFASEGSEDLPDLSLLSVAQLQRLEAELSGGLLARSPQAAVSGMRPEEQNANIRVPPPPAQDSAERIRPGTSPPMGNPHVLQHQAATPQRRPPELLPREASASQFRINEAELGSLVVKSPKAGADCPICMAPLTSKKEVIALPCNERGCGSCFHADCIRPWLERNPSCPLCRDEAKELVHPVTPTRGSLSPGGTGNPLLDLWFIAMALQHQERDSALRLSMSPNGGNANSLAELQGVVVTASALVDLLGQRLGFDSDLVLPRSGGEAEDGFNVDAVLEAALLGGSGADGEEGTPSPPSQQVRPPNAAAPVLGFQEQILRTAAALSDPNRQPIAAPAPSPQTPQSHASAQLM